MKRAAPLIKFVFLGYDISYPGAARFIAVSIQKGEVFRKDKSQIPDFERGKIFRKSPFWS
jgi:hypothetical protein